MLHGLQSFGVGLLEGCTGAQCRKHLRFVSAIGGVCRCNAGRQVCRTHPELGCVMCWPGVLKAPVAGYREGGLLGAGRGALLGAAGLLLKPAAGGLELTSKTFSGCVFDKRC